MRPQDGLAADDDELALTDDVRRGADDVHQLVQAHYPTCSKILRRSGSLSMPANGEF